MIMKIQQLHPYVELTTIYLSICKNIITNWLTISLSRKLSETHFSLLRKTLFLSCLLFFSCELCFECLLMVLFVGKASQMCLTCMKTLVLCLLCKTPIVSCKTCTITSVTHALYHVYTIHIVTYHHLQPLILYVGHVIMVKHQFTISTFVC